MKHDIVTLHNIKPLTINNAIPILVAHKRENVVNRAVVLVTAQPEEEKITHASQNSRLLCRSKTTLV